jgi:LacI family transcriptional regulator
LISLGDVAAAAGVSRATASRALSGRGRVSPSTRERVEVAAEKLGYRPDPALSALARYRWTRSGAVRGTYGLAIVNVLPDAETQARLGPAKSDVLAGVVARSRELNLRLEEHALGARTAAQRLADVLFHRGIDGIVFNIPGRLFDWDFAWERFACVAVGFDVEAHRMHRVASDWFGALQMCAARARASGARRLGFVSFYRDSAFLDDRLAAAIALEHGRMIRDFGPQPAVFDYPSDHDLDKDIFATEGPAFLEWFRRESPDAIIDTNRYACWWLRDAGVRMPDDVGYATLLADPKRDELVCSGAKQPRQTMGEIAVDLLVNRIQTRQRGLSDRPLRLVASCDWHDGRTLGAPA